MNEFKLRDLHISEDVIISVEGKVSIINIFQFINCEKVPIIASKFSILTNTTGPIGTYDQKIEIVDLFDEKIVAKAQANIQINNIEGGNNFRANFLNTIFLREGKYWIKVSVDEQVISNKEEHYVVVKKVV